MHSFFNAAANIKAILKMHNLNTQKNAFPENFRVNH